MSDAPRTDGVRPGDLLTVVLYASAALVGLASLYALAACLWGAATGRAWCGP